MVNGEKALRTQPEAETEAVELLSALAERYRLTGRTKGDLFAILASIASTAVIGMARIIDEADPDHPNCPIYRARDHIGALAHGARDETPETKGHGPH
jgi:hypothetical protein